MYLELMSSLLGFFIMDCITEVAWPEVVLGVSLIGTEDARLTHKLSRREETPSKKDMTTYKVHNTEASTKSVNVLKAT